MFYRILQEFPPKSETYTPTFQRAGLSIYKNSLDNKTDEVVETTTLRQKKVIDYDLEIKKGEIYYWRASLFYSLTNRYHILNTYKINHELEIEEVSPELDSWDKLPVQTKHSIKEEPYFNLFVPERKPVEMPPTPSLILDREEAKEEISFKDISYVHRTAPNPLEAPEYYPREYYKIRKESFNYNTPLLYLERVGLRTIRVSCYWEALTEDIRVLNYNRLPFSFNRVAYIDERPINLSSPYAKEKLTFNVVDLKEGKHFVYLEQEGIKSAQRSIDIRYGEDTVRVIGYED